MASEHAEAEPGTLADLREEDFRYAEVEIRWCWEGRGVDGVYGDVE